MEERQQSLPGQQSSLPKMRRFEWRPTQSGDDPNGGCRRENRGGSEPHGEKHESEKSQLTASRVDGAVERARGEDKDESEAGVDQPGKTVAQQGEAEKDGQVVREQSERPTPDGGVV